MVDGTDYPGFSEPEQEKPPLTKEGLKDSLLMWGPAYLEGIFGSLKMTTAAFAGALIAANVDLNLPAGDAFSFATDLAALFIMIYFMEYLLIGLINRDFTDEKS
ncbi:hypothetical protein [Halalkalicoccus ordinarius]|uniref:hypothetical protein n=1 Tax=Halalkalicoccus ordinarius TaxID=3116651 RepID=UPI00300EAF21